MNCPEITAEEAKKWKKWLAEFGIDLMCASMDKWDEDNKYLGSGLYPVNLRMLPGRTSLLTNAAS